MLVYRLLFGSRLITRYRKIVLVRPAGKREDEIQKTIQGIAEVLVRESGRTPTQCWADALMQ
jgi:hypothetical protein